MTHGQHSAQPSVAIVGAITLGYEAFPPDHRVRRAEIATARATEIGRALGTPTPLAGVVSDVEQASRMGAELAASAPAAVVVLALSAIRADLGWEIVRGTDAPVLVWAPPDHTTYPDDYDATDAAIGAAPVGVAALGNVLARNGRPFLASEATTLGDRETAWLQAARLAAGFSGLRFGLVGGVWQEMLDVILDEQDFLEAFGASWTSVPLEASTPHLAADLDLPIPDGVEADLVERSHRVAGAIVRASEGFDALAVRCHSDAVGNCPDFGVMGCLGVSATTSRGCPATCTGDMATAVAMLIASRLSGTSQYVEVDATDRVRGAVLLSNGGELDRRYADPRSIRLVEHQFFTGSAGRGLAYAGNLRSGPATLVAFTPTADGWRLISAEGDVLPGALSGFPVPHAFFEFGLSPEGGWTRFTEAGAPHHAVVCAGRIGGACALLCDRLGIEHRPV